MDDVKEVITPKLPQSCGLCRYTLSNYLLSIIAPVKSQGLSVISKKAAHTDVTQACRRIADGAMMKKAWIGFDQFMSLADALMDGLVVTDLHGGILDANRTASEELRRKEQDLVGKGSPDSSWWRIGPDSPVIGRTFSLTERISESQNTVRGKRIQRRFR